MKKDLITPEGDTAQQLGCTSLAELDRDIDNEQTRPVRGDGQEMIGDKHGFSPYEENGYESSEPGSDVERPSWRRRSSQMLSNYKVSMPEGETAAAEGGATEPRQPKRRSSRPSLLTRISSAPMPKIDLPPATQSASKSGDERTRNHRRRVTTAGGQLRLSSLIISPSVAVAPTPTVRSRSRAISHPDIFSLCQEWANTGPANQTMRYLSASQSTDSVEPP